MDDLHTLEVFVNGSWKMFECNALWALAPRLALMAQHNRMARIVTLEGKPIMCTIYERENSDAV